MNQEQGNSREGEGLELGEATRQFVGGYTV
jgi:hypothetical protein